MLLDGSIKEHNVDCHVVRNRMLVSLRGGGGELGN
jgi:hypothetical protein